MLYFVKEKTIHTFPESKRCNVKREQEPLRDTIPMTLSSALIACTAGPARRSSPFLCHGREP